MRYIASKSNQTGKMKTPTGKTTRKRSIKRSNVTPTGKFVQKHKNDYPQNDWVVFVKSTKDRVTGAVMYSSKLSRDNVRSAYAREFGIQFNETRSRRVRNF
jgi:hypothetical protein